MVVHFFRYPADPVLRWKEAQQAKLNVELDEDEEVVETSKKKKKDSDEEDEDPTTKSYNYLMRLSMWKLTLEQKEKLLKQRDDKLKELEDLREKTPSDLYTDDLDAFMEALDKAEEEERDESKSSSLTDKKTVLSKKGTGRKALPEYAPSPKGERIVPKIDEMLKKVEQAKKAKDNKGQGTKGRAKKVGY